jgi:hypothetical protein
MTVFYYNTIVKNPMTHFDFLILEIGPQWSNRILRLQNSASPSYCIKNGSITVLASVKRWTVKSIHCQRQNSIPIIGMDQSFSVLVKLLGMLVSIISPPCRSKNTLIGLMQTQKSRNTCCKTCCHWSNRLYVSSAGLNGVCEKKVRKIFVQNQIGAILIPWI